MHTSVTWNLMLGKNVLWVAKQHGHSVQVMLATYAAWIDCGGGEAEIAAIKAAMGTTPVALLAQLGTLGQPLTTRSIHPAANRLAVEKRSVAAST